MPYPTQSQEQAIIECETLLDYYLPATPGVSGVDTDARTCLRIAAKHMLTDAERDALIRFVTEWAVRQAGIIEKDRERDAYYDGLYAELRAKGELA